GGLARGHSGASRAEIAATRPRADNEEERRTGAAWPTLTVRMRVELWRTRKFRPGNVGWWRPARQGVAAEALDRDREALRRLDRPRPVRGTACACNATGPESRLASAADP